MRDQDLLAALSRINSEKFPGNFESCRREIEQRKSAGTWCPPVDSSRVSIKEAFGSWVRSPPAAKTLALLTLLVGVLLSPVIGLWLLFGLAGSSAGFFSMISIGYLGALISAVATLINARQVRWLLVAYFVAVAGCILDANFWQRVNGDLCKHLRSDPACIETKDGFSCQNSAKYGNFWTSKRVCD